MSTEFRPLIEVLRELKALALKKASGFLFVVTEENHSCIIRINAGQIEEVVFRMLRNDEAVQRLTMVGAAKARFQVDPGAGMGKPSLLSEDSRQWLMGGFEQDLGGAPAPVRAPVAAAPVPAPAAASAAPTASAPASVGSGAAPDEAVRQALEKVALNYLGPIAGMLCDEAWDASSDIEQVLSQLAANLATPQEAQKFMTDARVALAKVR
ncbi:hypothetical protein JH314_10905 [Xanthomonas campestris]|jgi:hypothetical protein|uniref:DUF8082 domain-containing protein n=3 Tax=Xanthomonas campestris pv. campestris TaxID=340 RepID=Q8P8Q7_XANCP|nr:MULTISPECIES: hypothetical protein [Xanthomonas]AAM41462.1 conserved hypothetical protein [Xanthomonas campestris pv. campestris str. ATCC 33913]AAY48999.1 conserved hypothetical protein [Xanthomonas campestris pv. campestris str. 8004]AKS16159.1 hypothetical protein AEA00_09575 [Xanthomonas campestris pv. campestris]AKS20178.1 hypothetical protein AEA01_09610 [Xanthomonas campestris pv. campestris]ALE68914.1 hypothetical protein AAW18_10875 [Xanthomonas campestris pv. campestris]